MTEALSRRLTFIITPAACPAGLASLAGAQDPSECQAAGHRPPCAAPAEAHAASPLWMLAGTAPVKPQPASATAPVLRCVRSAFVRHPLFEKRPSQTQVAGW